MKMDSRLLARIILGSSLNEARLPRGVRAQVSAKAYLAGAPSFVDLEAGDYVLLGYRVEGTEVVVDLVTNDGTKLPPLVAGTASGATTLGSELEAK